MSWKMQDMQILKSQIVVWKIVPSIDFLTDSDIVNIRDALFRVLRFSFEFYAQEKGV